MNRAEHTAGVILQFFTILMRRDFPSCRKPGILPAHFAEFAARRRRGRSRSETNNHLLDACAGQSNRLDPQAAIVVSRRGRKLPTIQKRQTPRNDTIRSNYFIRGSERHMTKPYLRISLALFALGYGYSSQAVSGDNTSWAPAPYRLGQGINFPQFDLNIGGYISVRYEDVADQDWTVGARDLSLFVSKNFSNRWQVFSELEIGQALEVSPNNISERDSEIDLERLYGDYRATNEVTFRIGKFLTPVGHWNQIHADPLVWTVDRPLTTAAPFARHATGVMAYGSFPAAQNDWDYNLFIDDSALLDPAQKNELAFEDSSSGVSPRNAFKRAAGARLSYHFLNDSANLGASYLRFAMHDLNERKDLFGIDALWTINGMEFSGEWIYRDSLGTAEQDERGGFLQAVLPLSQHLYLIGRQERYKAAVLPPLVTINSVGLTFRPHQAIAVKLEYRDGRRNEVLAPTGWLGSLAILF